MLLNMLKTLVVAGAVASVAGCATVEQSYDTKTGIEVTTVAVHECNAPSQTMTWVKRPGHKEDSYASTGTDVCAAAVSGGFAVAANAVLPKSAGITNTVYSASQSQSTAQQSSSISH